MCITSLFSEMFYDSKNFHHSVLLHYSFHLVWVSSEHFPGLSTAIYVPLLSLCRTCVAVLFVGFNWSVLTVIYIEPSNFFFWTKFPAWKFNWVLVHTVIHMIMVSIDGREFFDQLSEWLSFVVHLVNCVVKPALWIIWFWSASSLLCVK